MDKWTVIILDSRDYQIQFDTELTISKVEAFRIAWSWRLAGIDSIAVAVPLFSSYSPTAPHWNTKSTRSILS